MTVLASLVGSLVVAASVSQPGAELVLRGGEPAPSGRVVEVTLDGVVVRSSVAADVIVGWERVRSVSGEHSGESMAFVDVSDRAWRAMSRLARGDARAAEPMFEELLPLYKGRSGPTAASVFEGLLRCRLRRNAQTLAVGAWLQWLGAREATGGPQWYRTRAAAADVAPFAFDESTGLIPELPPIWLDVPAARVFAAAPVEAEAFGERERAMAELYRFAAGIATGRPEPLPRPGVSDPGVRLVWDVVAAQSAAGADRLIGREAIDARLKTSPAGWEAAWLKAAKGRSLLREPDELDRRRGLILLLEVYVRHERDCPYLAGLALAEAAVELRELGDVDGAGVVRRRFLDRFPGHPATAWDRIQLWDSPERTARVPGLGRTESGAARAAAALLENAWFRI